MAATATFVASHGLQTWALQVRTRIARQSEMATLHDMISAQGDQWLDAYFEDLMKAGPQSGGIAELVKTPGKKKDGLRTRAVAASAAAKSAKLAAANKENAPPTVQPAIKKTNRFQHALLAAKDNQVEEPVLDAEAPPPKKRGRPKKLNPLEAPEEPIDVLTDPSVRGAEALPAVPVKKGRPAKAKGAKGKKPKTLAPKPDPQPVPPPQAEEAVDEVEETEDANANVLVHDFAAPPVMGQSALTPITSPAHTPASPMPRKTLSPVHPAISPLKMSAYQTADSPTKAPVDEETLPEVDDLDDDLVRSQPHDVDIALTVPEAVSLSIIREDEEATSPPASHPALPPVVAVEPAPPKPASPKLSQPSLDEFATAPLPTRPPRTTLANAANGMLHAAHANAGPPPVQLQRASVGLRSSWLTKALREEHGMAAVPAVPPAVVNTKQPTQSAPSAHKRTSSELDAPETTSAPSVSQEPATKIRKITPVAEKEPSKSLRSETDFAEDDQETGVFARIKGKVEGLLVRADKDDDVKTQTDDNSESSFSLKRLTSRLSVSDLVGMFEGRSSSHPEKQKASSLSEAGPISDKVVESGIQLLQSTTPLHSPSRPTRQATVRATKANVDAAVATKAFAWATLSPTRNVPLSSVQTTQPTSQSTQSNTLTYVADAEALDNIPGTFTQDTAVASQTTDGGKPGLAPPSRTTSTDDVDDVENIVGRDLESAPQMSARQKGKAPVRAVEERYLFEGSGETSMFATYDHTGKGTLHENAISSQSNALAASTTTTVMLGTSTSSQLPPTSSQPVPGLFAQAGAFVSKALGMSASTGPGNTQSLKTNPQPVKSLQLAAAAAKKEQMEKDRKAARAKEIEERRIAVAQRKQDEEKNKEEDARKTKVAELERRKREREEASAASRARLYKTKVSSDDEPNKKRKLTTDAERKPMPLKKAPSQDTLRKGMKTPTPGAGSSTILKSSKPGAPSNRTANNATSASTLNKSTSSIYPALPSEREATANLSTKTHASSSTTSEAVNIGPSALKGGALRTSVMKTTVATGAMREPKVKESVGDSKQPLQNVQASMQARAQAQMQAAQAQVQEQARMASEQIVLPDIASEYSNSDDEDRVRNYVIPDWANSPYLRNQLEAQSNINPDDIFGAIRPLHMDEIFRTRQSRFRARTSSANWAGQDRLTPQEEMEYARRMGFL